MTWNVGTVGFGDDPEFHYVTAPGRPSPPPLGSPRDAATGALDGGSYFFGNNFGTAFFFVIGRLDPAHALSYITGGQGSGAQVDGTGAAAVIRSPNGIMQAPSGDLWFADVIGGTHGITIRKCDPTTGTVTTVAGHGLGVFGPGLIAGGPIDGTGTAAGFSGAYNLVASNAGNIWISEYDWSCVRKMTPAGVVTSITTPTPTWAVAYDQVRDILYCVGANASGSSQFFRINSPDSASPVVQTMTPVPAPGVQFGYAFAGAVVDGNGDLWAGANAGSGTHALIRISRPWATLSPNARFVAYHDFARPVVPGPCRGFNFDIPGAALHLTAQGVSAVRLFTPSGRKDWPAVIEPTSP